MEEIITCPKCKGRGEITKSNAQNYGVAFGIFTLGMVNLMDAMTSEEWQAYCTKCNGNGKIQIKFD